MGEIKFAGGLIMLILFSIAIVSYATNFAVDNEANISLANDSAFSSLNSELTSNVRSFDIDSNNSAESFAKSEISAADTTTRTGGQFKVGVRSSIESMKNIFDIVRLRIFGGDTGFSVVLTALIAFLGFVAIRYIWQTWKGGNAE